MQMVNRYLLEPLLRYKMQVWQIQELSVTVASFIFLVYQKRTGYVILGRKRLNKMHLQLFTFDTRK